MQFYTERSRLLLIYFDDFFARKLDIDRIKPKNLCLQITWPKDYPESDNAIIDLDSFFNSHIKVNVFNLYRSYTYGGVFTVCNLYFFKFKIGDKSRRILDFRPLILFPTWRNNRKIFVGFSHVTHWTLLWSVKKQLLDWLDLLIYSTWPRVIRIHA